MADSERLKRKRLDVEGRDEAAALIIISPRIILYPFYTDRSLPFSDLRIKICELVKIQGKCAESHKIIPRNCFASLRDSMRECLILARTVRKMCVFSSKSTFFSLNFLSMHFSFCCRSRFSLFFTERSCTSRFWGKCTNMYKKNIPQNVIAGTIWMGVSTYLL